MRKTIATLCATGALCSAERRIANATTIESPAQHRQPRWRKPTTPTTATTPACGGSLVCSASSGCSA
jgi:hypothetical protein